MLTWHEPVTVHSHREGRTTRRGSLNRGSRRLRRPYKGDPYGPFPQRAEGLARWPHGHSFIYLLWTDLEGLFEGVADLSTWLNDRI